MLKRIAVTALCVASLSGCASFISGGTGTAPVGTDSGVRSLVKYLLILQLSVQRILTSISLISVLNNLVLTSKASIAQYC